MACDTCKDQLIPQTPALSPLPGVATVQAMSAPAVDVAGVQMVEDLPGQCSPAKKALLLGLAFVLGYWMGKR